MTTPSFANVLPPPPPTAKTVAVPGCAGAGEALALAAWWQQHRRPILFLTRDTLAAAHLAEELQFFAPDIPAQLLPDWGCLPFDDSSPPADVLGLRLAALSAMQSTDGITIAAATTAMLPYPPPDFILARAFNFHIGDKINPAILSTALTAAGYARVDRVLAMGEFAIYGGQIDIFSPDMQTPFRLVLADDEIEQIRLFDSTTQLSTAKKETLQALPSGECDLSADGIARFHHAFIARFGKEAKNSMFKKIGEGKAAAGMEFMLPLFFEKIARLLDYAPEQSVIIMHDECREAMTRFMLQARRRQKLASVYEHRAVLPAIEVFMPPEELLNAINQFPLINLIGEEAMPKPPPVAINHRRTDSHVPLIKFLSDESTDKKIIIALNSNGRRESLSTALANNTPPLRHTESFSDCFAGDATAQIFLMVAPLRAGFCANGLSVLTEAEIFDVRLPPRRHRQTAATDIAELVVGSIVAHRDYGIGRYMGMFEKTIGGQIGEFLLIEYAEEQRLWLPTTQLHVLSPYYGDTPTLSKLGSTGWKRTRARAEKNARDTAARLLAINARRALGGGIAHRADEADLAKFADGFPYEETPDQATAVRAVIADMQAQKPMDRLIVADVGFGKTEVAMRAACCAALSGSQTAVLAPTTLLAEQHAHNFADRFSGFPIRVASLTRVSGMREKQQTQKELAEGQIDIIIGTHALLQKKTKFNNLGLAIIDEEHRFGVRQKEHFKTLRADMDILSLSATPIPRTMAMAMEGIRDISIITTPPPSRLAVRTTVASFSRGLIIDACERELLRGGQIYFVHNEIRTLASMSEYIQEWLPTMRIVIAHGGMEITAMEQAMRKFIRGDADLLLCTTIVESGLDITNANTMIINRADRMGVSRLHQLRGRVGRAGAQAYALLLVPPEGAATAGGEARLSAIADYKSLGSGLFIAMRDLETRGAGEILGEKQSGDIAAVGYAMYQKMINTAMKQLAGEKDEPLIESIIELSASALLPQQYVHSANERLRYYRLLSSCDDAVAVDDIRLQWEDRFGDLPEAAHLLIMSHKLRLLAASVGATKLRLSDSILAIEFADATKHHEKLVEKISAGVCRPAKDGKTIYMEKIDDNPLTNTQTMVRFLSELN